MKILIKLSTILVALTLLFTIISVPAAAAGTTLYFSDNSVEAGEKVSVTVSVNPEEAMYAVSFYLQYNDSVLKYDSGSGNENSAGVLKAVESPSGEKSVKYTFNFTAKKAGSSTISVTDCVYVTNNDSGTQEKTLTGASASLTVKDVKLSSDAKLKSLKVSGYSLSPAFSSSKTSYSVTVPFETEKINVTAKANDSNAKVASVKGNTDLDVGKNTVIITVEAENGTQKEYKITVTREKEVVSSETSSIDETESETSSSEETESKEENSLQTIIGGTEFSILTKIPKKLLFDGFKIETKSVNGYDVETAVSEDGEYNLFYLREADSEDAFPYLYDAELDQFEKLPYITIGKNTYIISDIPQDFTPSGSIYNSKTTVNGFSVECLSDANPLMTEFHYLYCYNNGSYNYYRFDSLEGTLHRFPEFTTLAAEEKAKTTVFDKFKSLSANGKVIITALAVLILGIVALLVMLIIYLFKRNSGLDATDYYEDDQVNDFDSIDIQSDNNVLK